MRLSVIIPTYDNHDLTVVHARESMNCARVPDEVIVVNDGGDPGLLGKLKTLDFKCRFVYVRVDQDIRWNYNGACNLGAWISTGDFLAFEDNDNIPTNEFYEQAIRYLENHPSVGRVTARVRRIVGREEILNKPKNEWVVIDSIGPNQGTSVIRRDIYTLVKGQDERFCGEYGYMYYEWKRKLLNRAKTQFGSVGAYYYTNEGQSSLPRNMSVRNKSILRKNSIDSILQSPIGILNFTYTVSILRP